MSLPISLAGSRAFKTKLHKLEEHIKFVYINLPASMCDFQQYQLSQRLFHPESSEEATRRALEQYAQNKESTSGEMMKSSDFIQIDSAMPGAKDSRPIPRSRLSCQHKCTRQRLVVRRRFGGSRSSLTFICEYCHRLHYCMHYWTSVYCLPPGLL